MRRIPTFAALAAAILVPALSVHAQTASGTVFQVNAHFAYPGQPTLHSVTGTITIDTSAGKVTNVDLKYDGLAQASVSDGGSMQYGSAASPVTGITETWTAANGRGGYSAVALVLPVASLAGYAGGALCSKATPCSGMPMSSFIRHENFYLADGQISAGAMASASAAASATSGL